MSKTRNAGGGGGIPPSNTVAPVISGTAVVGQTLSSTTGTWIGTPIPTYTYQWYRGISQISGATSSTYTLVQADATFAITCEVTATNIAGIASATSNSLTITDADAQAFFTASGLTGATNLTAINDLVVALKGYGIWTKMKAIYPMVGGTAALHKWNLKDPQDLDAAFRLVFTGGWTHSSTGALPNGINAYANSFLLPATTLTLNSAHLSYYSRTNVSESKEDIGCWDGSGFHYTLLGIRYASLSNSTYSLMQTSSGSYFSFVDASSQGFYISSRTSSVLTTLFKNGTSQAGSSTVSTGNPAARTIYVGGCNGNTTSYSSKECAFSSIGDGLNATESANFYTAVQAYNTTLGRSIGPQTVSDPDAQAFVTAANIEDQVQANAVNQLVIDMKTANIWTKMKAIYPFVGGTAASHKWNLKDPQDLDAAFRLVFNGGWTHSSTGALPNGTNGYADTKLNMSTNYSVNTSVHISYYSRTDGSFTSQDMAVYNGTTFTALSIRRGAFSNQSLFAANETINYSFSATDPNGAAFYISNRTALNVNNGWRNSTKVATGTNTAGTRPSLNMFLANININGAPDAGLYGKRECAFASIGDGLTDTEAADLYLAVQNFNTTLSRQV